MEKEFLVIGLMSGTSLDGLDVAACRFRANNDEWEFSIEKAESVEYDSGLRNQLAEAVYLSGLELSLLDLSLGRFFGESVKSFCGRHQLKPSFVSSHGHTIFHQPDKALTLQIGNPESLSHYAGLPVIANFRLADVLKGGQGAPLVPMGERHLFPDFQSFLNLGGIANIAIHSNETIKGFDVTACNMALNYLAGKRHLPYDANGDIAKSGTLDNDLLEKLNSLPFFSIRGPKSLGFEWFSEQIKPLLDTSPASLEDTMCTFVHHIAWQVNQEIARFSGTGVLKIMATGGGANNHYLINKLNEYGQGKRHFEVPDRIIVEYKEALIFAFLGLRRALGLSNISHLVTGASSDVSAGSIHGPVSVNFL